MQRGTVHLIVALALAMALAAGSDTALLASPSRSILHQEPCAEPDGGAETPCPDTMPEAGPVRPGTVLLRESFDDPAAAPLGAARRVPGQSEFAYADGYLRAHRLAEDGTAVFLLPYDPGFDDATVAVNAQLFGEIAGRFLVLGCRRQDTESQSGYRLAVAPDAGLFTLVRREAARETTLASWQESAAILRGAAWNRLELTCAGATIDAIINGRVVASVRDSVYARGQALIGVGVFSGQGAPAEANFDDLTVTHR